MNRRRNLVAVIILTLILIISFWRSQTHGTVWDGKSDLKIGVIADDAIGLVAFSPNRKMINILSVPKDTEVWLPQDKGWIKAGDADNLLSGKNGENSERMFYFYNFGSFPNYIVRTDSFDNWRDDGNFIQHNGIVNWLRMRMMTGSMIVNSVTANKNLDAEKPLLDEILPRDFADGDIINEDIRWSLYNTTGISGLADFMASRMNWMGLSVVSTENSNDSVDVCRIEYGEGSDKSKGLQLIKSVLGCQLSANNDLNSGEAELYLGGKLPEVIKYLSYVRTF